MNKSCGVFFWNCLVKCVTFRRKSGPGLLLQLLSLLVSIWAHALYQVMVLTNIKDRSCRQRIWSLVCKNRLTSKTFDKKWWWGRVWYGKQKSGFYDSLRKSRRHDIGAWMVSRNLPSEQELKEWHSQKRALPVPRYSLTHQSNQILFQHAFGAKHSPTVRDARITKVDMILTFRELTIKQQLQWKLVRVTIEVVEDVKRAKNEKYLTQTW